MVDVNKLDESIKTGWGVFAAALSLIPYKEVLPKQEKLERYIYWRECYLQGDEEEKKRIRERLEG